MMSARHYRLLLALAASVSLLTAGCASDRQAGADSKTGAAARTAAHPDESDQTLLTVLGLAKRESQSNFGPPTGPGVSPVLWMASHDALKFAGISSEDAMTGLLVTNWYSPPDHPNERLRVTVFITSRALRSDSLTVSVERQVRAPDGGWKETPVATDVVSGLENAILLGARRITAERYREKT